MLDIRIERSLAKMTSLTAGGRWMRNRLRDTWLFSSLLSRFLKQCRWIFDCHIQQVFHFCTDWVTSTWERMIWNLEKVLTCHSILVSVEALQLLEHSSRFLKTRIRVFPVFWKQSDFYCQPTYKHIWLILVCQQHAHKINKSIMHPLGEAPVLPLLVYQIP